MHSIRLAQAVTFGFVWIAIASSQTSRPNNNPISHDVPDPESLLIRSYLKSKDFTPSDRALLLNRLAAAASKLQPPLTKLWSEEAFQVASKLPLNDENRQVYQANAAVELVTVDPKRAFEVLAMIDPPEPTQEGQSKPMDMRTYAAENVFPEIWKTDGVPALDHIRAQAEHIGETGEYPYRAIGKILPDVGKRSQPKAETLFTEALSYYTKSAPDHDSDREFALFLSESWGVVPRSLELQALKVAVAHLNQSKNSAKNSAFMARVQTAKGASEFTELSDELLYELLPKIRELDPQWAQELTEKNDALGKAATIGDKPKYKESVVIHNTSGASPAQVAAAGEAGLERSRLRNITDMARSDPEGALRLSAYLADPTLRSIAVARIAAAFAENSPERAEDLIKQDKNAVEGIQDKREKVRVLVALAEAAGAAHDRGTMDESLSHGLDLGEEVLQEYLDTHPGANVYTVDLFREISKLITLGMREEPNACLEHIAGLSNPELQAHLLIDAAQALVRKS